MIFNTVSGSGTIVSRSTQLHKESVSKATAAPTAKVSKLCFYGAIPGIKLSQHVQRKMCKRCLMLSKFRSQFNVIYSVQQPKHVAVISMQQQRVVFDGQLLVTLHIKYNGMNHTKFALFNKTICERDQQIILRYVCMYIHMYDFRPPSRCK